jgi:hypothetical protein
MSTIETYITGANIAATLTMARTGQVVKKPIVLTAGDKDQRVIRSAVKGCADVVPGSGKLETLDALNYLDIAEVEKWLVVVVDADFDRVLGVTRPAIVFVTDSHDMDCEHVRSDALVKVVQEICSQQKCQRAFGIDLKTDPEGVATVIREKLISLSLPLGLLRLISVREALQLSFKNIDHKKTVASRTLECNIDAVVDIVLAKSKLPAISPAGLKGKLITEQAASYDPWQICQGHDVAKFFVISVRKYWGVGGVSAEEIERSLRLAYESNYFWRTELGVSLKQRLEHLGCSLS